MTHNGPAILSAPHRFPTESPLLRQLFNRPPLPSHTPTRTQINTNAQAHANTRAPMQQHTCTQRTYTHKHTQAIDPLCASVTCAAVHTAMGLLKCS